MTTPRWLLGPKAHVIILFMIQFILLMVLFGMAVPLLHRQGVSMVLLVLGSIAAYVLLQLGLGALGKLVPVRCQQCRSSSRYMGAGWWPFTYRYRCTECGNAMQYDVVGG